MDKASEIQVFENADLLSIAACHFIVQQAKEAIAARRRFVICLSGGNTPEKLYTLLADNSFQSQIDWAKTYIFWGDERCVPLDDEKNNAQRARTLLLDKIEIPSDNIFPIPVDLSPAEAAGIYEQTLRFFFGGKPPEFDLVLLGLGEDGHTASLFPGTKVLAEESKWVSEVYVQEQDMFRITITAPLLNQARHILFLVTGANKASIFQAITTAPYAPEKYPAQLIKPVNGYLHWMLDKSVAPQS